MLVLASVLTMVPLSRAQSSSDGYIELQSLKKSLQQDTVFLDLYVVVHFPDYTLPGMRIQQSGFKYQLLLQVEDEQGQLVYSRTISRKLPRYPLGSVDTVQVAFSLPIGQYRLFITPLNIPVYIQDLANVPLPLALNTLLPRKEKNHFS